MGEGIGSEVENISYTSSCKWDLPGLGTAFHGLDHNL